MRKLNLSSLLFLLTVFIAFNACSDSSKETTELDVKINYVVNGQPLNLNQSYTIDGQNLSFSLLTNYISEITLITNDNESSTFELEKQYQEPFYSREGTADSVLVTPTKWVRFFNADNQQNYRLGEVETGAYKSVRLRLGVPQEYNKLNAIEVAQIDPNHPLALVDSPRNWWSWNSGYIMTKIEGNVDLSATGGDASTPFFYHLGAADGSMNPLITLNQAVEITSSSSVLTLTIDLADVMQGIDLTDSQNRSTMVVRPPQNFPNDVALANQVLDNLSNALSVQ